MSAQAEIAAIIAEADSMYVHVRVSHFVPLVKLTCISVQCQLQLLLDGRVWHVSSDHPPLCISDMICSPLPLRLSHNLPHGGRLLLESTTNGRDRLVLSHQIYHHDGFSARVRTRLYHIHWDGEIKAILVARCTCSPEAADGTVCVTEVRAAD